MQWSARFSFVHIENLSKAQAAGRFTLMNPKRWLFVYPSTPCFPFTCCDQCDARNHMTVREQSVASWPKCGRTSLQTALRAFRICGMLFATWFSHEASVRILLRAVHDDVSVENVLYTIRTAALTPPEERDGCKRTHRIRDGWKLTILSFPDWRGHQITWCCYSSNGNPKLGKTLDAPNPVVFVSGAESCNLEFISVSTQKSQSPGQHPTPVTNFYNPIK